MALNTYIVLLRGINVGGKNILPMKMLKALLQKNGFENVRTYIQSGNVVVDTDQTSAPKPTRIESLIESACDVKPSIIVLKKSDFLKAVKANPFTLGEGKQIHFYFCSSRPKLDNNLIEKYQAKSEQLEVKSNVCYLYAPDGIGRSKLVANMESCLGVSTTGRNLNTINKLMQMCEVD